VPHDKIMIYQMRKHTVLIKQIIYFGLVGLFAFGIDLFITVSAYNVLHFSAYMASGAGFISGLLFNFPMNRKRVFKHAECSRFSLKTQMALYVTLCVINLFATSLLLQIIVSSGWGSIAIAKIIVTILIAIWNFILFKLFIFSRKNRTGDGDIDERTLGGIY
jgi:putative flippase GtrA